VLFRSKKIKKKKKNRKYKSGNPRQREMAF